MSGLDEKAVKFAEAAYLAAPIGADGLRVFLRAYLAASAPPAPDGLEPVAWRVRHAASDDSWSFWQYVAGDTAAHYSSLNRTDIQVEPLYSAATLSAQEAEIERLRKERAEEQEIWPKWAAEICKCLRGYGVDPGDGEGWDLPAQFEDWVRGVVENETARAESAEAEVARLESDLSRANHALETALSEHAEIRDALTVEVARLRKVVERAKALIAKNWTGYCWHMVTDADADEVRQFAEEVNRALQTKEKTNG
jgi:hypothetical protein